MSMFFFQCFGYSRLKLHAMHAGKYYVNCILQASEVVGMHQNVVRAHLTVLINVLLASSCLNGCDN